LFFLSSSIMRLECPEHGIFTAIDVFAPYTPMLNLLPEFILANAGKTKVNIATFIKIIVKYRVVRYFHLLFIPEKHKHFALFKYINAEKVASENEIITKNVKKYGITRNSFITDVAATEPITEKITNAMQKACGNKLYNIPLKTPVSFFTKGSQQEFCFVSILFIK